MTDYLDRLAQVAAEANFDTLPEPTVEAAKRVLLDTLGAIVAGSALPENTHLARLAAARAPHGVATLLGHGATADAGWAALVNARPQGRHDPQPLSGPRGTRGNSRGRPSAVRLHGPRRRAVGCLRHHPGRPVRPRARRGRPRRALPHRAELFQAPRVLPVQPL